MKFVRNFTFREILYQGVIFRQFSFIHRQDLILLFFFSSSFFSRASDERFDISEILIFRKNISVIFCICTSLGFLIFSPGLAMTLAESGSFAEAVTRLAHITSGVFHMA